MSGTTEVTLGEPQTYEHTIKINNFQRMTCQAEVRTKYTEIFPGKKVAFVVKNLSEMSPSGLKYTKFSLTGGGWTDVTETDRFLTLELLAGVPLL